MNENDWVDVPEAAPAPAVAGAIAGVNAGASAGESDWVDVQTPSVATEGLGYVTNHPFKSMFQGLPETLTGKTLEQRAVEGSPKVRPMSDQQKADYQRNWNTPATDYNELGMGDKLKTAAAAMGDMALAPINAIAPGVGKLAEMGAKQVASFGAKNIEKRVVDLYNSAVGGMKIKNPADAKKFSGDRLEMVKTIHDNLPNIQIPDEEGQLVSKTPENRLDLLHAHRETKAAIWKNVEAMSKGATNKNAMIDLGPIVDDAENDVIKSLGVVALKANPSLVESIGKASQAIKAVGQVNPTQAESYLKFLNQEISRLRQSGQAVDYSIKDLYSKLAPRLNVAMDDTIEKALSQSGYGAYRKQYAALKSGEKEILRAANKHLAQKGGQGGLFKPITDIWSLEELLQAGGHAATGNAAAAGGSLLKAAALRTAGAVNKYFRNPDRKIQKMFELAGKYDRPVPGSKAVPVNATVVNQPPLGIAAPQPIVRPGRRLPGPRTAGQQSNTGVINQPGYTPPGLPNDYAPRRGANAEVSMGALPNPGNTAIRQPGYVPPGLPDKSIQMGKTGRSGIDRPWENHALPSPDKAGRGVIYQGTTYTPVEKAIMDSTPKTDFGRQIQEQIKKKYEVPLHPAEAGRAAVKEVFPEIKKGNPNIPMHQAEDFKNMYDWESYQQKGGPNISGGKAVGKERVVTGSPSGHSKAIQAIGGPKKAFHIMEKAANGEKMTLGEKVSLKRMIEDYKKNVKPLIDGDGPGKQLDFGIEPTDYTD